MFYLYRVKVTNTKLTLIQISPDSFSLPTDVTLKLSDGAIKAHRVILAAVSTPLEKMLYGDFKEGRSSEVKFPTDNFNIMKMLVDFIYSGTCELGNLDDTIPLMELVDRYQINKVPFLHMCSEAILPQLDSSNYLTLLPKYVSVMSEESHKKAADKVMSYTNNDFVSKFDKTKDLPEEVLLPLLKSYSVTQPEIKILKFLVKWYRYQTRKSLQLTTQLFQNVRYFLIPPQSILSTIIINDFADKQLIVKAFHYLYNSPCPLGSYGDGSHQLPPEQFAKLSTCSIRTHWIASSNMVSLTPVQMDRYDVKFYAGEINVNSFVVKSMPLSNGIHSFTLSNLSFTYIPSSSYGCSERAANINGQISIAIVDKNNHCLDTHPVMCNNILITLCIHDSDLFIKFVEGGKVKSTFTTTGGNPFVICICNSQFQAGDTHSSSFSICDSLNI